MNEVKLCAYCGSAGVPEPGSEYCRDHWDHDEDLYPMRIIYKDAGDHYAFWCDGDNEAGEWGTNWDFVATYRANYYAMALPEGGKWMMYDEMNQRLMWRF